MANTLLLVLLILLILAVAGPLFLVQALGTALKVFLWVVLILLVIGLVGSMMGGAKSGPRYN